MRNKAFLTHMELLVMLLVFALAAAMCLQVFAKAAEISQETARREEAVLLAQNGAELLKATGGDAARAEALSRNGYHVEVTKQDSPVPGLGLGEVTVYYEKELLFSLQTGWQEVTP